MAPRPKIRGAGDCKAIEDKRIKVIIYSWKGNNKDYIKKLNDKTHDICVYNREYLHSFQWNKKMYSATK